MRRIFILLKYFFYALLPVAALAVFLAKAFFVEIYWGGLLNQTHLFFFWAVIKHDAAVLAAMLFLYFVSLHVISPFARVVFRLAEVGIFGLYGLDFAIIVTFATRITLEDIFKYALHTPDFILSGFREVLSPAQTAGLLAGLALLGCALVVFVARPCLVGPNWRKASATLAAVFLIMYLIPRQETYAHAWIYQNVFEYNSGRGVDVDYSPAFRQELEQRAGEIDHEECRPNPDPGKQNIVVLVVESLSMYHSRFFSGLEDMMPGLDRIAAENTAFVHFHANGFTTESALTAMLLGIPAVPPVYVYSDNEGDFSFQGYFGAADSLPRRLRQQGYTTEFLTSGDLAFAEKARWLKSIGFDYLEGHDHPFYAGWPRHVFSSAPDAALYARALKRVFDIERPAPFFMMIETVSTHQPFIDPETKERSEAKAFAYADRELEKFYDALKTRGFFDNGVLLITSDQHSMKPLTAAEVRRFGDHAYALIPLIVAGQNKKTEIVRQPFQQVDIYASLINSVSGQRCVSAWRGDFLAVPRRPAECIFYVRGDDRDKISVFCGDRTGQVRLRGDRTGFLAPTFADQKKILDKINFERLRRASD